MQVSNGVIIRKKALLRVFKGGIKFNAKKRGGGMDRDCFVKLMLRRNQTDGRKEHEWMRNCFIPVWDFPLLLQKRKEGIPTSMECFIN